ncbi:MAG: hypothetical protein ACI9DF_005859 [Verrucomicrobiales bacterium]|jgi:hypothetical protein
MPGSEGGAAQTNASSLPLSQYLVGTTVLCSTDKGAFAISSGDQVRRKSRNRSYVTFIDTSEAEVGQYRVSFDVSDFRSDDDPNTALYLHLYEGGATTKGHVKFQLTQQTELPTLVPTHPPITTALGGQNWQVLMDNPITGNGRFSLSFGLTNIGKPGDYLALVWSQVKHRGSASMPSMTIDNVNVAMLPSPPAVESTVKMPGSVGQDGDWALQDTASL